LKKFSEIEISSKPFKMKTIDTESAGKDGRAALFKTNWEKKSFSKMESGQPAKNAVRAALRTAGDAVSTFSSGKLVSIGVTKNDKIFVSGVKLGDYYEHEDFEPAWRSFEKFYDSRDTYVGGKEEIAFSIDRAKLTKSEKEVVDKIDSDREAVKKKISDWFDKIKVKGSPERIELEKHITSRGSRFDYYDHPEKDAKGEVISYDKSKAFDKRLKDAKEKYSKGKTPEQWNEIERNMREFAENAVPSKQSKAWTVGTMFGPGGRK